MARTAWDWPRRSVDDSRPRDFTLGLFKYKSTPAGVPPTDEDLERIVARGLPVSAMPYFSDLLSADERRAVISYVKHFSHAFDGAPPQPIAIAPCRAKDQASIDRGCALCLAQGCAGCHGPDGRKGGCLDDAKAYPTTIRDVTAPWTFHGGDDPAQIWLRLRRGVGTMWSRNISSDRTGIGGWTDAEVARAICSGISRNGRVLHWQAMPWDHESNRDEEDLRAIVAYVRMLPPVVHDVPATQPPRADDCETYTFWVADDRQPGCH